MKKMMKKTTRITALLTAVLMLAALLTGCATKAQSPAMDTADAQNTSAAESTPNEPTAEAPEASETSETSEAPQEAEKEQQTDAVQADTEAAPAAEGAHIAPIPSAFDPMNLADCMFNISFTNDDIVLNDEGTLVLHLTVWEQELFDMVDIAMLKVGDTITVRGEDISVDSVERTADNVVHINAGAENGGVTLVPEESGGVFHESTAEVSEYDAVYTAVAQLTLPVDADQFVYTDTSDPEGDAETYFAGDLLVMKDTVDFSCAAMNGVAHIVNNQVMEITRSYMP